MTSAVRCVDVGPTLYCTPSTTRSTIPTLTTAQTLPGELIDSRLHRLKTRSLRLLLSLPFSSVEIFRKDTDTIQCREQNGCSNKLASKLNLVLVQKNQYVVYKDHF